MHLHYTSPSHPTGGVPIIKPFEQGHIDWNGNWIICCLKLDYWPVTPFAIEWKFQPTVHCKRAVELDNKLDLGDIFIRIMLVIR